MHFEKTIQAAIALMVCFLWTHGASALGTSPEREKIVQAIAAAHGSGADPANRTCLPFHYSPERFLGPFDTEFGWTPVKFAAHLDARSRSEMLQIERVAEMLVRADLLSRMDRLEGLPRYGLTWKGFSLLQAGQCFRFASSERKVAVQSFEKVRVQNGSDIYRVMATSVPESRETWLDDPEFAAIYPEIAIRARGSATPAEYEVALWADRYVVIKIPGVLQTGPPPLPPKSVQRAPQPQAEEILRQVGTVDRTRALALLKGYELTPFGSRRVCLRIPIWSVDETNFAEVWKKAQPSIEAPNAAKSTLYFTIYNAGRLINDNEQKVGYEFFRRLERAGLARSARMPASEWKGYPAKAKTQFELTPAGMSLLAPHDPGCIQVGEFSVAEVLRTETFSVGNLRPKFAARSTFTPDPAAVLLVAEMGPLRRLKEIGGASHGHFAYLNGKTTVELIHELVFFRPDPRGIRLPE